METILTAFIVVTLILFAGLTVFNANIQAQETLRAGWQAMETRLADRLHTDLTPITAVTQSSGAVIELTLRNDGDTRLADFTTWDVIIEHYNATGEYNIDWFTYVNGEPADGEWRVVGIYEDAVLLQPETFEQGILNPGEQLLIRLRALPPVGPGSVNRATIATANGVGTSVQFSR